MKHLQKSSQESDSWMRFKPIYIERTQEGEMVDVCEFFRREGGQEKCLAQLKLKFHMQKLKIEMY